MTDQIICDVDFHYNTNYNVDYLNNTYEIKKQDELYKKQLLEVFYLKYEDMMKSNVSVGDYIDQLYDDIACSHLHTDNTCEKHTENIDLLNSIALTLANRVICDDKKVGFAFLFSFDFFQILHEYLVYYIDVIRPYLKKHQDLSGNSCEDKQEIKPIHVLFAKEKRLLKALEDKVKNTIYTTNQ